jgi:hypothetical protein
VTVATTPATAGTAAAATLTAAGAAALTAVATRMGMKILTIGIFFRNRCVYYSQRELTSDGAYNHVQ